MCAVGWQVTRTLFLQRALCVLLAGYQDFVPTEGLVCAVGRLPGLRARAQPP